MKIGIIVFPGSNCDRDVGRAVRVVLKKEPIYLWHKNTSLENCDVVIVPGGFSYGDYLRCGAIARYSPIMSEVVSAANQGLPVLGICNGFQILTEAGLLPGVLMRNQGLSFICDTVGLTVHNTQTPFTKKSKKEKIYQVPIAHMEGNYFIDDDGLKAIEDKGQIVFRYDVNPNGARDNIAGVCNDKGNVVGLMPHPERVCEDLIGGTDGRFFFESLV